MKKRDEQILVLTYWGFEDGLIQGYTLPYLRIILKNLSPDSIIHLFTLEKKNDSGATGNPGPGIRRISAVYYPFGFRGLFQWLFTFLRLFRYIKKNKISTIHCWCTPAGAAGYILSRLTGVRLILDSYEPHAQAMVENGTWKKSGLAYRILWYLEKKQTQRAVSVIATTEGMKAYANLNFKTFISNFYVKPACVDLQEFSLSRKKNKELQAELKLENKIVCVYAGKFGGIYYKEEVFLFFKAASAFWKDKFHILLLTPHSPQEIADLAKAADLPMEIFTRRFVPHARIADYIGLGDFALSPVKPVPSKRYCSPVKDGEYWAMGLPVLIPPGISDDSDLILEHKAGCILDLVNEEEFQTALGALQQLLSEDRQTLTMRIRHLAEHYRNYSIAQKIYHQLYS